MVRRATLKRKTETLLYTNVVHGVRDFAACCTGYFQPLRVPRDLAHPNLLPTSWLHLRGDLRIAVGVQQ